MSHAPLTAAEYWDKYKPGDQPVPDTDRFEWTQYPGHGPGAEMLGQPRSALDLGPAEGREAAHLAKRGVEVTAVDFSPVQVERARDLWKDLPTLSFVHAEVCEYLTTTAVRYDAVYSVWGAVWFTDPEQLLPLVAGSLAPGGVFAFSQAEPVADSYGPQPMRGKWLEGREKELTVPRWQYDPETWADLLKSQGFVTIEASVLSAPEPGRLGTLMVRAHSPS